MGDFSCNIELEKKKRGQQCRSNEVQTYKLTGKIGKGKKYCDSSGKEGRAHLFFGIFFFRKFVWASVRVVKAVPSFPPCAAAPPTPGFSSIAVGDVFCFGPLDSLLSFAFCLSHSVSSLVFAHVFSLLHGRGGVTPHHPSPAPPPPYLPLTLKRLSLWLVGWPTLLLFLAG